MSYADYSVSIDDGQTAIFAGQALTYTVVVRNNGPATPLNGARCLTPDEIDAIRTWILECAPKN